MSQLSFRSKLLLAMMLVVIGVSVATLLVTQRRVQRNYEQMFRRQFERQIAYFTELQQARLGSFQAHCLSFAESARLIAALNKSKIDVAELYRIAEDELREVLDNPRAGPAAGLRRQRATAFRFLDASGQLLSPPDSPRNRAFSAALKRKNEERMEFTRGALTAPEIQQIGYAAQVVSTNEVGLPRQLLPRGGPGMAPREREGMLTLQEIILTKVVDPAAGRVLGALAVGFPVPEFLPQSRARNPRGVQITNTLDAIQTGILIEDVLYSSADEIPQALHDQIAVQVRKQLQATDREQADFDCRLQEGHYRVFYQLMNAGSVFPPAYQVCLYPMEEARREQRELRVQVLGSGGGVLLLGLLLSLFISHGLSAPIRELVVGTHEVQRGNFGVRVPVRSRDELGSLASSFNEMAEGLALKEKYRSVLNMVADEKVAQQLVAGQLTLGGELREITVLFCDIRGFTAITQNMPPSAVIEMLNEHMTALTAVVKEYDGVLDKYVGDLLMAIFGAPLNHGNDALNAVSCALRLLHARAELNQTSRHHLEVGIGLATGTVVAGCMGSADRLNYTVLGERVNLASRLCARAGPGEVLIDDTTRLKLADSISVELMGELELKGFASPMQAFKLVEVRRNKET